MHRFVNTEQFIWPDGVVPYQIEQSINEEGRKLIGNAIALFKDLCVEWRDKTSSDTNYVTIGSSGAG